MRAELVPDPQDYPKSSHGAYLAQDKAVHWLFVDRDSNYLDRSGGTGPLNINFFYLTDNIDMLLFN